VAGGTSVANGANVPFTSANFINTPPGTRLSIVNSGTATAAINIADTGYYQITYGVSAASGFSIFALSVGGVTSAQQTLQTSAATGQLTAATCIVQVASNPTQVALVNSTGASVTLQNFSGTSNTILAFITITKVR
jgi:hypothetical protein